MNIQKYKYYCKKPRSAIAKDILRVLLYAGLLTIAATSPYFGIAVWKAFSKKKKYPKRNFADTFTRLRRKRLLNIEYQGHDMEISLTEEGKKAAGYTQIDALRIPKPQKWDGKWRLVMFDIAYLKKPQRDAFRSQLRKLGFLLFQKSVWIYPFPCKVQVEFLRNFFGLGEKEVCLITADNIGARTSFLEKHFQL